jgi:hypothetical protein
MWRLLRPSCSECLNSFLLGHGAKAHSNCNINCTVTDIHGLLVKNTMVEANKEWTLNKADSCPHQPSSPVMHASGTTMSPITLHSRKGVLDMFWA